MINQPSPDVTLPEDLKRAIEDSRNIVSVNEAEALRLRELALSSQYSVNELQKTKKDLDDAVLILTESKETLKNDVVALQNEIKELQDEKSAVSKSLQDEKQAKDDFLNGLSAKEAEITSKEAEITAKTEELSKKATELEAKSKELEEQEQKIKVFADSLCTRQV